MKKLLYLVIIMGGTIVLTSCGKDEECVCDNGVTITEEDADPASLSDACDVAQISGSVTCEIK